MTPKTLKMIFLPAILGFMVLASGCASMFGDNTRTLTVNSEPQGAVVYYDNIQYGTTPATITLPNYIYGAQGLTFRKSGYQDQAVVLTSIADNKEAEKIIKPEDLKDGVLNYKALEETAKSENTTSYGKDLAKRKLEKMKQAAE